MTINVTQQVENVVINVTQGGNSITLQPTIVVDGAGGGMGDMTKAVYDPQLIEADAFNRANHTGTQAVSTVSGLQTALDSKDLKRTNLTVTKTNDTYTLQASDVDKRLFIPAPCTVIVPNGLAANLEFEGKQTGTGDVEFVAESGGTLNVNAAFQKFTEGEHAYWGIVTLGSDEADLLGTLKLSV